MRISDWSSDVCSSDLEAAHGSRPQAGRARGVSQALFPGWRPTGDEAARLAPVAATLRDAIRERGLKSGSFRRPDQWHVTLCFIGHGARHLATPALLGSFARASAHIPLHSFRIERIAYRSEEHTSELQSLMRNPYSVFSL